MKKLLILMMFLLLGSISLGSVFAEVTKEKVIDSVTSSASQTIKSGVKIYVNNGDRIITNIEKQTGSGATIAYIYADDGITLLNQSSFIGNNATFNFYASNNTYYQIVADKNGASYTRTLDTSPLLGQKIYFSATDGLATLNNPSTAVYNIYAISTDSISTTPEINHNTKDYYNTTNITINLNTTTNTNMSYILDLGTETSICNDCNLTTLNLNSLSEGAHSILFVSTDENGQVNTSANFTIDLTPPVIVNFIYGIVGFNSKTIKKINTYNYTQTEAFLCSDINLKYCNVTIDGINFGDFWTDSFGNSYVNISNVFTTNGYKNISFYAEDKAGNIVTNGSFTEYNKLFINPNQTISFQTEANQTISNYTINDIQVDDIYYTFQLYDYGIGTFLFNFSKPGLASKLFNITFNTTSDINTTYIINLTKITVNIYDRSTNVLLTQNVTVNILGLALDYTTTGSIVFQNLSFDSGSYIIEASALNYFNTQKSFTFNNQESITIDIYLLSTEQNNSATLYITTYDNNNYNRIASANILLEEFDTSTQGFKDVGQCTSDSNGECAFLIESGTKTYRVSGLKVIDGIVYSGVTLQEGEIFQPLIVNGVNVGTTYTRSLYLKSSLADVLPDYYGLIVQYPETEENTIVFQNDSLTLLNIPVNFSTTNNLQYTVCINAYLLQQGSRSFITDICSVGSSGTPTLSNLSLSRDYSYVITVTATFEGKTTTYKTYSYLGNDSLWYKLSQSNLVKPFMFIFWVVLLGFAMSAATIVIFTFGSPILSLTQTIMFPNFINMATLVYIVFISLTLFYLTRKEVDSN